MVAINFSYKKFGLLALLRLNSAKFFGIMDERCCIQKDAKTTNGENMNTKPAELHLSLQDNEWTYTHTTHVRQIARGIVVDTEGNFYFVRADRDDDFGKAIIIETAGGGVESGEDLATAIVRELREELGVDVTVLCKVGVVDDYYNLIHRHNVNNYFLCKVVGFGEKHLTADEMERWHLSTLKLSYDDAVLEYEKRATTPLGRLVCNRELPILKHAKLMLDWYKTNP